jgi:electron transfer flavoprotein beta subunit
MGVDRAVLVTDRAFAGSDTLATSKTLSAAIKKLSPFDLVIFGARSSDSDTGQVGSQTAVLLDLPFINGVKRIVCEGDTLNMERNIDEYSEGYVMTLPGAVAVHPRAIEPRDAALSMVERHLKMPRLKTFS